MSFYQAKKYLSYILHAKDEHSIHSPFVYALYTEVVKNACKTKTPEALNELRGRLLEDETAIEVCDLGAGSKKLSAKRTVKEITKYSVISQKYGDLLFRLVHFLKPKQILELGTSLGLSSLYMSQAASGTKIITVEGCQNTYNFAKDLAVREDGAYNAIEFINSSFDAFFENSVQKQIFDFMYIDGNHTYEATLKYFNLLLDQTNENSVLVFDDIYWSEGMTKAWEEIKSHPKVTVSIDLFKFGIIFFRKENKQQEHFCLRY